MSRYLFFLVLLSFMCGCQKKDDSKRYIFLGHPYDWNAPNKIDPRLAKLDYSTYDQIWIGGDVCSHLTADSNTLAYVDDIFHISSPNTLWTIGNHDILEGHEEWIKKRTKRPFFYSVWQDGLCIIVLNTNLFWYYESPPPQRDCELKNAQLKLLEKVTDTIQKASHLIILHHLSLLSDLRRDENGKLPDDFNINPENIHPTCDSNLVLTDWLYPRLQHVQKRGIQVILVGGDFGMRSKQCEYMRADSIYILGSGINNSLKRENAPEYVTSFGKDKVLIFDHHPTEGKLDWAFYDLDSLFRNR